LGIVALRPDQAPSGDAWAKAIALVSTEVDAR
jgi:hypothetical protein